jgi:hypothetical protein
MHTLDKRIYPCSRTVLRKGESAGEPVYVAQRERVTGLDMNEVKVAFQRDGKRSAYLKELLDHISYKCNQKEYAETTKQNKEKLIIQRRLISQ